MQFVWVAGMTSKERGPDSRTPPPPACPPSVRRRFGARRRPAGSRIRSRRARTACSSPSRQDGRPPLCKLARRSGPCGALPCARAQALMPQNASARRACWRRRRSRKRIVVTALGSGRLGPQSRRACLAACSEHMGTGALEGPGPAARRPQSGLETVPTIT